MDTTLFENALANIKRSSIEEFAEMLFRQNTIAQGEKVQLEPVRMKSILDDFMNSFPQLAGEAGADDLIPLLEEMLKKNKDLVDRDLIAKLTILVDLYDNQGSVAYQLISAASALTYIVNLQDNPSMDDELLAQQGTHQQQVRQEIQDQIVMEANRLPFLTVNLMVVESSSASYMKDLASNIDKAVHADPKPYAKYNFLHQDASVDSSAEPDQSNLKKMTANDLSLIRKDSAIPASIKLALEQYHVVNDMNAITTAPIPQKAKYSLLENVYADNKTLLKKSSDSAGVTFLKILGTVFSLGLAAPFLWRNEPKPLTQNLKMVFPAAKKSDPMDHANSFAARGKKRKVGFFDDSYAKHHRGDVVEAASKQGSGDTIKKNDPGVKQ